MTEEKLPLVQLMEKFDEYVAKARQNRKRKLSQAQETKAKRTRTELMGDMARIMVDAVSKDIEKVYAIDFADLKIGERIGQGGQGSVWKGLLAGQVVAVKAAQTEDGKACVQEEMEYLREVAHPNIVTFLGTTRDPDGQRMLVFEYCVGGSLDRILARWRQESRRMGVATALNIAIDVAQGLAWMHHRKVMHRDLKPDNILLTGTGVAKIADLGSAKRKFDQTSNVGVYDIMGSAGYRSPEVIADKPYGASCDIFSFGMVLCTLVRGDDPSDGSGIWKGVISAEEAVADMAADRSPEAPGVYDVAILAGKRPLIPEDCPLALASLVRECWQQEAEKRPTATDVLGVLTEYRKARSLDKDLMVADRREGTEASRSWS